MTRRNKKCRKAAHRRQADAAGCGNKENTSFSNIFCCKEMQNFRIKTTTGPTARGCQLSARALSAMLETGSSEPKRKQPRSRKKNKSPPHEDWFENNRMQNFPKTKISSIAFFIPLDNCLTDEKSMDFNDVLYYNSTNSAMLIRYQHEQESMIAFYHIPLVPEPQIKYRTSSESSANSEDSVVCFAYDIEEDSLRNICQDVSLHGGSSKSKNVGCCVRNSSADHAEKSSDNRTKRVQFVNNAEPTTVHLIIAWEFAYRAARISPWETAARDSIRFRLKIQSLEPVISPILDAKHREKIWRTRMQSSNDE